MIEAPVVEGAAMPVQIEVVDAACSHGPGVPQRPGVDYTATWRTGGSSDE